MASETILDADVRADLAASHQTAFDEFRGPGDWLTGAERTALIRVTRAARSQADQPPWYRPSTDQSGSFDPLPDTAVDAAWRLTNHPGTLTADWYADTIDSLPSAEYYVELVGVVAITNTIDRLATMLDLDPLPLPEPVPGEPARPTIESSVRSHWVPTSVDARDGANVLNATSVAPAVAALRTTIGAAHYMSATGRRDLDWSRGTLDRRQIELIAAVTSMHNECFY